MCQLMRKKNNIMSNMKSWELAQDIIARQGRAQKNSGRIQVTMSDKQTKFMFDLLVKDAVMGPPILRFDGARAVKTDRVYRVLTDDGRIWFVGQFPKRGGFISEDPDC